MPGIALLRPKDELRAYSEAMKRELDAAGVPYFEMDGVGGHRRGMISALPRFIRFMRRRKYDLVHAHAEHADLAVSVAGRFAELTMARTIHNSSLWSGWRLLPRFVERGFISLAMSRW